MSHDDNTTTHKHEWTEKVLGNNGHGRYEVQDWCCTCGTLQSEHHREWLWTALTKGRDL